MFAYMTITKLAGHYSNVNFLNIHSFIKTNHARIAMITSTVPLQHQRNKPYLNGTNKPPTVGYLGILSVVADIVNYKEDARWIIRILIAD
jgi:hypothetical protein